MEELQDDISREDFENWESQVPSDYIPSDPSDDGFQADEAGDNREDGDDGDGREAEGNREIDVNQDAGANQEADANQDIDNVDDNHEVHSESDIKDCAGRSEKTEGNEGCQPSRKNEDIMGYTPKELGERGENAACKYLEHRGFDILARNWKCSYGEADVIAQDKDALVFIEVKTRAGTGAGLTEEAVTAQNRPRYEKIAMEYLKQENELDSTSVRFDVISITLISHNKAFLRHHRDAFGRCE